MPTCGKLGRGPVAGQAHVLKETSSRMMPEKMREVHQGETQANQKPLMPSGQELEPNVAAKNTCAQR